MLAISSFSSPIKIKHTRPRLSLGEKRKTTKHQNMQFGATMGNLKSFAKDEIWYFCGIRLYVIPCCLKENLPNGQTISSFLFKWATAKAAILEASVNSAINYCCHYLVVVFFPFSGVQQFTFPVYSTQNLFWTAIVEPYWIMIMLRFCRFYLLLSSWPKFGYFYCS